MRYINPESAKKAFTELKASPYFVDKSSFISKIASSIGIAEKYVCITRPRRFGKTSNAQMLAAFLSRGLDTRALFGELAVAGDAAAMRHLGSHDVIYIDFSVLPDECSGYDDYIDFIRSGIVSDLRTLLPEANIAEDEGLFAALSKAFELQGKSFCFVMDEWDSIFFNPLFSDADRRNFLMFLKQLLKTKPYVEFAYLTGILPIAKHSTGSDLNMFVE